MGIQHWLQLAMTPGIGPMLSRRLIDAAGGDAELACESSVDVMASIRGIGASKARHLGLALAKARDDAAREMELADSLGVRLLCPDDDEYPILLKTIDDPPNVLWVRGTIEPRDLMGVAIVGSRKCSLYGREQAERFGGLLAGAGITVLSGGARGIDAAAHRGAIQVENGRTIAVLGCGVDIAYPPENERLFAMIAPMGDPSFAGTGELGRAASGSERPPTRGAVISEFPLGTPPLAENFPCRNRVVSGMSRGVLVIEADIKSGALITARLAGEDHGRTVFALPGRVDNPLSEGPHQLLRDGATMVASLEDVLGGLSPLPIEATEAGGSDGEMFEPDDAGQEATIEIADSPDVREVAAARIARQSMAAVELVLSPSQRAVFDAVTIEPTSVDVIIEATQLPAGEVLRELTVLSLKALVKRVDGQSFVRRG